MTNARIEKISANAKLESTNATTEIETKSVFAGIEKINATALLEISPCVITKLVDSSTGTSETSTSIPAYTITGVLAPFTYTEEITL